MKVHPVVKLGQIWRSNDPRHLRAVRVERIISYETGLPVHTSRVTGLPKATDGSGCQGWDRVHVLGMVSNRESTIRRDQFCTGARGWSLEKNV